MAKTKQKEKTIRAIRYALSIIDFQEVGMGPDRNLSKVKSIVADIVDLCEDETGIKLENYPTEFLKNNSKLIKENKITSYTLKMIMEDKA